jgi:hypothetical protein
VGVAEVDELLTRLAEELAHAAATGRPLPERLCLAAVELLGCDGGAITMAYTHAERVTLCTTDGTALRLEEMQDVVGQGPGSHAYTTGHYARLDLLDVGGPDPRWPLLESEALASLAPLVVHAIPMQESKGVVGVLTLYQRGTHRDLDLDAAAVVARVTAAALLADGPSMLEAGQGPWAERAEVHQATGMVLAQLHLGEQDALALLRAHAFSVDPSLRHTAHDVLSGALTFTANQDQEIESS